MKTITITCWQKVKYTQEITITEQDYETLKEVDGENVDLVSSSKAFNLINLYLDQTDVVYAEEEYTDFEIEDDNEMN